MKAARWRMAGTGELVKEWKRSFACRIGVWFSPSLPVLLSVYGGLSTAVRLAVSTAGAAFCLLEWCSFRVLEFPLDAADVKARRES